MTTAERQRRASGEGMVGRVYRWRGELWRVLVRWQGAGPRNVLIENLDTGERVVRPFRGLRSSLQVPGVDVKQGQAQRSPHPKDGA